MTIRPGFHLLERRYNSGTIIGIEVETVHPIQAFAVRREAGKLIIQVGDKQVRLDKYDQSCVREWVS